MKTSIIIPTFNRERYICQAIESALAQTTSGSEIIVVDDGSTDSTTSKVQPYLDRIKYVKTENSGPGHARNVGMRMALGEFISFLDSDDLYYPYKIELQNRVLERFQDVGMVCSELSGFDDEGFWDEFHLRKYHRSGYESGKLTFDEIFEQKIKLSEARLDSERWADGNLYLGNIFDMYFHNMVICTNTMMLRRTILEKVGFQNEQYRIFEEHDFALRICKKFRIAFLDIPTYKLRYHGQQISDVTRSKSRSDGLDIVIEKQRNKLQISNELGVEDAEYYTNHREMVDHRMIVLFKALAIPLMCKIDGAVEARQLFKKCRNYGHSEYLFWLATFLPTLGRKAVVKIYTHLQNR